MVQESNDITKPTGPERKFEDHTLSEQKMEKDPVHVRFELTTLALSAPRSFFFVFVFSFFLSKKAHKELFLFTSKKGIQFDLHCLCLAFTAIMMKLINVTYLLRM